MGMESQSALGTDRESIVGREYTGTRATEYRIFTLSLLAERPSRADSQRKLLL